MTTEDRPVPEEHLVRFVGEQDPYGFWWLTIFHPTGTTVVRVDLETVKRLEDELRKIKRLMQAAG